MSKYHTSVLLQEIVDALRIQADEKYIDATLGGGGHTKAILDSGGKVLGIDQDEEAIAYIKQNFQQSISNSQLKVAYGNFEKLGEIAKNNSFEDVSGILFDLGVSSHQLDEGKRGFSFLHDAPLDMRMDTKLTVSAKDLVNGLNKGELLLLFTKYGEEPFAKRIAEKIVKTRESESIDTTMTLAKLVASVYPKGKHKIHPATKVFQALRIAVNDEFVSLENVLPQALELLKVNGRIAVISFHSLEDRIVKRTFLHWEEKKLGKNITKKPIEPGKAETEVNKRSRSSKLRIFEKN